MEWRKVRWQGYTWYLLLAFLLCPTHGFVANVAKGISRCWSRPRCDGGCNPLQVTQLQDSAPEHFLSPESVEWIKLVLDSYRRTYGKDLIDRSGSKVEQAHQSAVAPFPILSHDFIRDPKEATFIYGNDETLKMFEYTWEEFTNLPSKLCTASEEARLSRQSFLDSTRGGKITPPGMYEGVRVSKSGKLFEVRNLSLWNVEDTEGVIVGQAACFRSIRPLGNI